MMLVAPFHASHLTEMHTILGPSSERIGPPENFLRDCQFPPLYNFRMRTTKFSSNGKT